ncbi:hypothetical protein RhiirC2_786092 [Rhizophagus irregularis]|uniref:Uncharacterized protein n=1 Tax=Rhizophagus irregularis TaxID=588596 RepID=A0A2N1MV46_9GLOM|nr:hypothetical protein RhiirC2_786092 [Rhizophagus irregularis]
MDLDKIKYISLYSANSILEFTNTQFREIIDYVKTNDNNLTNLKKEDFCDDKVVIAKFTSSSKNFDYYNIANKISYPLCSLDYDDEKSIESKYKAGSYFIKCE